MNDNKAFIDTNIFIYTQRTDSPGKRVIAENVINQFNCVASTQVLNEIANVFTKKYPMPIEKVECLIKSICEISEIVIIDDVLIIKALNLQSKYKVSYFDCLMIAAAIDSDCKYLLTEDMQDGIVIDNTIKIISIFNHIDLIPETKNT